MRRHVLLGLSILILAGAAGVALLDLRPGLLGRTNGGPLACPSRGECGRSATGLPLELGASASIGPLVLRNEGDTTVTLERVELLDIDSGLELIGTLVVEPDGIHPLVGSALGYPPPEPGGSTHSVRNYRLEPAETEADYVQVLFGLRIRSPGRAGARRIAVDYRAGDRPYRAYFDHSMWLCTARFEREEGCIDPSR